MEYIGKITIADKAGKPLFERELGTDEIIEILLERVNFFQKPPQEGEPLLVGPHNVDRVIKKIQKDIVKGQKKERICSVCSKPGHRKDNCITRNRPPKGFVPASVKDSKEPLTEKEYNEVQQGKKDDLTSAQIAGEMNVNIQEVNWAFMQPTYDNYLRYRAK